MEQRQVSRSEQKIQKMNSSMVVFRELIESLRSKNQQLIKPYSSDINPQTQKQSSSQSRLYSSEKINNVSIVNNINNSSNVNSNLILSSYSMPVVGEDEGIRLKARGNVAGRDILNKKPSVVPSSKFNETVSNVKDIAKNKNLSVAPSPTSDTQQKHPALQQIKLLIKKQTSVNSKNEIQSFVQESQNNQINKHMTTMPLMRPKFQQNKLNLKAIATRNKIKDINQASVIKYCKQSRTLHQGSQANEIFDFFDGLMSQTNVAILSPFIKKFKNCVYFGAPVSEDQTYEGFLYFYQNKIYYGQFLKSQKNGKGVEVIIDDDSVFKGIFKQGQKTGKFWVKKQNQTYVGFLQKGVYHGHGKLQTKQSIYQGQFQNGQKHGFGEEFYPKTGVKMVGYFNQGTFSKRSRSSFSHSDIQKAIKFKSSESRKVMPYNKNHSHNKSNNTSIIQQQVESTRNQNTKIFNQIGLYTPPFSSSNNFHSRKMPFNKQKIRSFLPGMSHQRFVDPMPQNCRDFDYSFDTSSKRDTQSFTLIGVQQGRVRPQKQRRGFLPPFGQIQQQQYHLDTSAFQQPLPMPTFFKK